MQECYHPEATFSDPAFGILNAEEVKAMWEMLLRRAPDLGVNFNIESADEQSAEVSWIANYVFSATKRQVINPVHSRLVLKDGLIYQQTDSFNFHNWAKQSLGLIGMLLGGTTFLQNKTRAKARQALMTYMGNRS